MRKFTHKDIEEALGQGFEFQGIPPTEAMEVCVDTRILKEGDLFVGLKGGDKLEIAAKAAEKGARACVLSCECGLLPCYRVVDTVKALQDLAAYQRARVQIPMVAVTGSCGKTTTKNMLGSILGTLGETLVTKGNLNNEIGLPLTLLRLGEEYSCAVVEMGMNHKGEILALSRLARPEAAVITNIGSAHIEFLGSRENIAEAKGEIFRGVPPCGRVALPFECDFFEKLSGMAKHLGLEVISFGKGGDVEFRITKESGEGLRGELTTPAGKAEMTVPVLGGYNALNIAAAAAGSLALIPDIPLENLKKGLESVQGERLRNEIHRALGATFILDCYNANPDSLSASLGMLKDMPCEGRKIAFLGDMLEIGEKAREAHYAAGEKAGEFLDALFVIGENAEHYLAGAKAAGKGCFVEVCQIDDAAEKLAEYIKKDDLVLFKGSRANKLEDYFFALEK
ncbi:UDP-N-acetylmuramoyl-tripeptide--D-alanyl-D-alanine ligase [bacterium]|nr:UDP-N-acetylmuramoyl-tripeptide--D-alanyl-D-alanine ligase [bacterium]